MIHRPIKVLKSDQVLVNGSVRLEIGGAHVRTESDTQAHIHTGCPQEARIVESNNEYAIIEVVCSCGAKSHIQCNYADIAQSGTPAGQE